MGLKELDLLKTTLLKIDDVDNEVKQLRDESKILRKEIKNNESTITKRELEISNLEQQIPTLENNLENKIAKMGEEECSSISEDQSELNKLKNDISVNGKREKKLIEKWNNSLDKVPSEGSMPIYVKIGLFGFGLTGLGMFLLIDEISVRLGEDAMLACFFIWLVLWLGPIIAWEEGRLNTPNRRQLKVLAAEIVEEHGPFDYRSPHAVNKWMSYSKNIMFASCVIEHYLRDKKYPIELFSERKKRMDGTKKLFFEEPQPLPRELVDVISSNLKNKKNISALASRISAEMRKVRIIDNQKSKINREKHLIAKKKLSIPKKQVLISKEKSSAKRKKKQVDTNATKVNELKKERKNLWASISHLIPYSDLIN